mmetsp:Transcript_39310/g.116483  ORF Transcript_39310/g.116483 Transcript_39310/m.116483 type:complete len:338 (-) Transcript_39310:25-1038(-)
MDRSACFAAVLAAAEATPASAALPQAVFAALLEDPTPLLFGGGHCAETVYQEAAIEWRPNSDDARQPCGDIDEVVHEVSQRFRRPLSFGRQRCFRLHRFNLQGQEVPAMMGALSHFASSRAEGRDSELVGEEALRGSNLRGFQDVIDAEDQLMASLRRLFVHCVGKAAAADKAEVVAEGSGDTPPPSPRCANDSFSAWMNVSGRGAMNILHNHGASAYAAVAYTQTPQNSGREASAASSASADKAADDRGALLLRLSRGTGAKFMEPDEDLHVSRMSDGGADGAMSVSTESGEDGVVRYVRVQPQSGSLLIFPGWVSHSVTPHFEASDRVCYASNWS